MLGFIKIKIYHLYLVVFIPFNLLQYSLVNRSIRFRTGKRSIPCSKIDIVNSEEHMYKELTKYEHDEHWLATLKWKATNQHHQLYLGGILDRPKKTNQGNPCTVKGSWFSLEEEWILIFSNQTICLLPSSTVD